MLISNFSASDNLQLGMDKRLVSTIMVLSLLLVIMPVAYAQTVVATVPVGNAPVEVGVNSATNKIYVANHLANTVSVIDGATDTVVGSPIAVGSTPRGIGVNSATNKIYVSNENSNTVSVINGATNMVVATVTVGSNPHGIGVNTATNKIYVANASSNTVSVIFDPPPDLHPAILSEVQNIEGKLDGTVPSLITQIMSALTQIQSALASIQTSIAQILSILQNPNFGLEEIKEEVSSIQATQYVPFKIEATGLPATCDVAGGSPDTDSLTIDGGSDFTVTSVIIFPTGVNEGSDTINVDSIVIDGTSFATSSLDLTGLSTSPQASDIIGTSSVTIAGKLPTTITAVGTGGSDIIILIKCNAGSSTNIDFNAGKIIVSGSKLATDAITATYAE